MNEECDEMRREMLELEWSGERAARIKQVLAHLSSCAECQARAAEYQGLRAALTSQAQEGVPVGGWEAFDDRLARSIRPRSRGTWSWRAIAAAVFLTAFTAANAWMFLHRGSADIAPQKNVAVAPPSAA